MTKCVVYTALEDFPMVEPGDDLPSLIVASLERNNCVLETGDVLTIAQKVVSKSEDRYVRLRDVSPSSEAHALARAVGKDPRHIQLVLNESSEVVRYRQNVLIVAHRLGFVMANAGIDESNIEHGDNSDIVLLLPEHPDRTCAAIKENLDQRFGVSIGVIINDSFGRPWRNGVVGVALGAAGVPSLRNMIGTPDLFGRPLKVTEVAVADEIAAAASLLMGQGSEGLPVVHIRGLKFETPANSASTLVRPRHLDMFR